MVWVLPCNFDARCHHGSTRIVNNRTINIFGRRSCESSHSCGSSFGFGNILGMFGIGLGMQLGQSLIGGITSWINGGSFWGGTGLGNGAGQANGGYVPGAGAAGTTGCTCGCQGSNRFGGIIGSYIPGQYSVIPTGKPETKAVEEKPETEKPATEAPEGKPETEVPETEDPETKKPEVKPAEVEKNEDGKPVYKLDDITENVPADKLKEARANFWKSIGAKGTLKGLENAALPKGFDLKADKAGNIYLIHDGVAYKYDEADGKFRLPAAGTNKGDDFRAAALANKPTDEKSEVINVGQKVNQKMVITSKTANDTTVVETAQEDGVKSDQEAVKEAYTLAHGLINHNSESKITVYTDKKDLATRTANQYDLDSDKEITFDEFIAIMNGYNVDADKAAKDADYRKGRKLDKLKTVDIDAFDTIQLVEIFNKYANETKTHITLENFAQLVKDIKGKSATELYNIQ